MEVLGFQASIVAVNANGDLLIALFDGGDEDRCVGIFRCKPTAGVALQTAISSALISKANEK